MLMLLKRVEPPPLPKVSRPAHHFLTDRSFMQSPFEKRKKKIMNKRNQETKRKGGER